MKTFSVILTDDCVSLANDIKIKLKIPGLLVAN